MDSLLPPTALYALLAVAVAVTARVTTESAGEHSRIKAWKKWLLHFPVVVAWLHLLCYLLWQLFLYDRPPEAFDRTNMIIHTMTLMSVGLAGGWIYMRPLSKHATGQAPLRSPALARLRPRSTSLARRSEFEPRSLLQKCQLPCQGSVCTSIRPENAPLHPLEARFLSFRGLPTADSVDLVSHRTFAAGLYVGTCC